MTHQLTQPQDLEPLWKALSQYGTAQTSGHLEKEAGSGDIDCFGYYDDQDGKQTGALIHNWQGEKRFLKPATKENIIQTLEALGITQGGWQV